MEFVPLITNYYVFSISPQVRTSNLWLKYLHILIYGILLTTSILLIYVSNKYDTTLVIFLGTLTLFFFLNQLNKKNIKKDGTLNPMPNQYKRYYNRLYTLLLIITLNAGLFYYTQSQDMILMSIMGSMYLLLLISFITYASCHYRFPLSWNI